MERIYPSYCVAIRTLGTAGEKYLETLRSCERQTVKAEHIFVYIPHNYPLPKETIGIEEYIRCEKGMVSQRALPFDEITTEFILFLDDDLSFQEDFVKILFDGLIENEGDCISPDIYPNHKEKFLYKVRNFFGGTKPHWKKDWAMVIRNDSHYSYNISPQKSVLKTQSAAGACALCRKSAYLAIHFEDEKWMERYPYPVGEDQVFFYKLFCYGFKTLIAYDAKIIHLDAGAGHMKDKDKFSYCFSYLHYLIWRRTVYETKANKFLKLYSSFLYNFVGKIRSLPLDLLIILKKRSFRWLRYSLKGYFDAKKYAECEEYKSIPDFLIHKNN